MKVSLRGKGKSAEARQFKASALENLYDMKQQLIQHTYRISLYKEFIVTEPKRRVIKSGAFRDKVLQHCLCDYVLLPRMQHEFIIDNCAGQLGKGTLFGLDRLTKHLLDYYNTHGSQGYILKCDITKFFYSIKHDKMKEVVAQYFDDENIRWICNLLIDSVDGDGLPLGNQTSQVFALMYLAELDKVITEEYGFDLYGRYMDDFYIICDDKEKLKVLLVRIKDLLAQYGLTLNGKTEIVPIKKGIRFLGFHVYLTDDGKVIRKLNGDRKRQTKKKLRKCAKLVKAGKMSRKKFDEIFQSMMNHLSHGNCYHLRCELTKSINEYLESNEIQQERALG